MIRRTFGNSVVRGRVTMTQPTPKIKLNITPKDNCCVCLGQFRSINLISDGICNAKICRDCMPQITDGKCPNCREEFPWNTVKNTQTTPEFLNQQLENELSTLRQENIDLKFDNRDFQTQLEGLQNENAELRAKLNVPCPVAAHPKDLYSTNYKNKKGQTKTQFCLSDDLIKQIKNNEISIDAFIKNM